MADAERVFDLLVTFGAGVALLIATGVVTSLGIIAGTKLMERADKGDTE